MAPTIAQRLDYLESTLTDLIEAHNSLDERHADLHYKILFLMDTIKVRRVKSGMLDANGNPIVEEGSVSDFWQRDGAAYIKALEDQAHALEKKLADSQAVADAARDTIASIADAREARKQLEAAIDHATTKH